YQRRCASAALASIPKRAPAADRSGAQAIAEPMPPPEPTRRSGEARTQGGRSLAACNWRGVSQATGGDGRQALARVRLRRGGPRTVPSTIPQSLREENAMGQYSKVEADGHLLIVTINRPEVANALHPMANQELSDVFDEFAANPQLWVAIITGAGDKAF